MWSSWSSGTISRHPIEHVLLVCWPAFTTACAIQGIHPLIAAFDDIKGGKINQRLQNLASTLNKSEIAGRLQKFAGELVQVEHEPAGKKPSGPESGADSSRAVVDVADKEDGWEDGSDILVTDAVEDIDPKTKSALPDTKSPGSEIVPPGGPGAAAGVDTTHVGEISPHNAHDVQHYGDAMRRGVLGELEEAYAKLQAEKEAEAEELSSQLQQLRDELDHARRALREAEDAISAREHAESGTSPSALSTANAVSQKDGATTAGDALRDARRDLEAAAERERSARKELSAAEDRVHALESRLKDATADAESRGSELSRLREELARMREQSDRDRAALEEAQKGLERARTEAVGLQEKAGAVEAMAGERDAARRGVAEMRKKVKDAEALAAERDAARREAADAEKALAEAISEGTKAREESAAARDMAEELEVRAPSAASRRIASHATEHPTRFFPHLSTPRCSLRPPLWPHC